TCCSAGRRSDSRHKGPADHVRFNLHKSDASSLSHHFWARQGGIFEFIVAALVSVLAGCSPHTRIVVGSKNFTEQIILGELIAQQIENKTHLPVERRFYLGGTYIAHQSIPAGRIDIYPEYTGTALTAVLKQPPASDRKGVYDRVKSEYEQRFHLR